MHRLVAIISLITGLVSSHSCAFDIGLVPLHPNLGPGKNSYGKNISLHGTPQQIEKLRHWIAQIAAVPKGLDTLIHIQNTGHKLFIYHSAYSMVSSGRTSAPASQNLINGKGESVDIHFNASIPDHGSHLVLDGGRQPIEYTAAQNLFHELAHALHMMQGTWLYFKSERQAIMEENIFRKQLASMQNRPFKERYFITGLPICPEDLQQVDDSWSQQLICTE